MVKPSLVETQIIQVTVDNTPPEVAILYPLPAQTFAYPQENSVTVQLSASDDLLLASVEVYLDGVLLRTFTQPPFSRSAEI